jgi:cell division protein FtsQ
MNVSKRKFEGTPVLPGMDGMKPRIRSAPAPKREVSTWRIAMIVSVIAAVALISVYAIHTFEQFIIRDSRFALNGPEGDRETLQVSGAAHASLRQIEMVFAGDSGRSVYLVPLDDRRTTLRTVDWVKDASIVRLWPNRVLVHVAERTPVAFISLSSSRFGLIDEDGVILPPAADRFTLPVLAGVNVSDPPSQRRERVHRMVRVTKELGEAAAKVSQIDVTDPDDLKIMQAFEGRMVTLLLGDHNFGSRYQNFLRNFPEIKRRLPGANTLDLRLEDRITVVE